MERVLSKNTNELKTGAPGRFDRHRPMASPRSGACRRRCRRFEFPVRTGKTPSSNGMPHSRAETWIQARAAPGPERASRLRHSSPGLDSGPLGWPLFRRCTALSAARSPPLAQTWHSKIAIRDQYRKCGQFSPSSASLVTPISTKPRQPRGKSHPSLQCHNWPDWVADEAVWSYPVSAGNHEKQGKTGKNREFGPFLGASAIKCW